MSIVRLTFSSVRPPSAQQYCLLCDRRAEPHRLRHRRRAHRPRDRTRQTPGLKPLDDRLVISIPAQRESQCPLPGDHPEGVFPAHAERDVVDRHTDRQEANPGQKAGIHRTRVVGQDLAHPSLAEPAIQCREIDRRVTDNHVAPIDDPDDGSAFGTDQHMLCPQIAMDEARVANQTRPTFPSSAPARRWAPPTLGPKRINLLAAGSCGVACPRRDTRFDEFGMKTFEQMIDRGHERVCFHHDPETGLRAIVGIHSTKLGNALGLSAGRSGSRIAVR